MSKRIKVQIVENEMVFNTIRECAEWIGKETGLSVKSTRTQIARCLSKKPQIVNTKYKVESGEERISTKKRVVKSVGKFTFKEVK